MNLKAKVYQQAHQLAAEQKLAARLAILKEKGANDTALVKDPMVKKIKADIRKAKFRLRSVAAQEKLMADKVQAKADKLEAKKLAAAAPKAPKGKKQAAAEPKKEKKAKVKKPAAE
jgi:hypothetical protein